MFDLRELKKHLPPLLMTFDVEAIGLYGEGFAVGWVVHDLTPQEEPREIDAGYLACIPANARGTDNAREWVAAYVLPHLPDPEHVMPTTVRALFLEEWIGWAAKGAWLAADVPFPVETNFLALCAAEAGGTLPAPVYPLVDIASALLASGLDPLAPFERRANELPAHHPLSDARQSSRLFIEALGLNRAGR